MASDDDLEDSISKMLQEGKEERIKLLAEGHATLREFPPATTHCGFCGELLAADNPIAWVRGEYSRFFHPYCAWKRSQERGARS